MENAVEDLERVRAIFELAVQQNLDMPEIVWKVSPVTSYWYLADTLQAYIDFEVGEGERERARELYERLLERTAHVKVYISYALMDASTIGGGEDEDGNEIEGEAGDPDRGREVFDRGYKAIRQRGEKEDVGLPFQSRFLRLTRRSAHCSWKHGRHTKRNMALMRTEPRFRR